MKSSPQPSQVVIFGVGEESWELLETDDNNLDESIYTS